jgi:glycosyltransferase involved in cell wall biosynthesis
MSVNKKIRVLHFLSHGNIGGQERAQYQLLRAFAADDEFTLSVAIGKSEGLYVDLIKGLNIPIIDLHIYSGYDLRFDRNHLHSLRQFHIHHLHDPSPNHMLLSILSGGKIKRIFTRRGGIINYNRYGFKRRVKFLASKFLLKYFFDGFSGNTQIAAEFVRSFYNIKHKVCVLYNGIDFSLLQPKSDYHSLLEKMKIDKNDFKVGTACQLVGLKRVDLLIRAFSLCDIYNKKLIIFGKGPEKDNLHKLVLSLGLERNVLFAGEVPNMADFFQVLDCFVLASGQEESFGNAVVEAMFQKVPSIIMSDSGGLREHITDSISGFIASDLHDLAQKMEFVHFNPEASRKVAENASKYVFNKYSIENMKLAYKQFYREVMQ